MAHRSDWWVYIAFSLCRLDLTDSSASPCRSVDHLELQQLTELLHASLIVFLVPVGCLGHAYLVVIAEVQGD